MDGADGWRVGRYAQENAIIGRIMLRFRPIAPKPAAVSSTSGISGQDNQDRTVTARRSKRKYVRARKNNRPRSKKKSTNEETKNGLERAVLTLQHMPEKENQSKTAARDTMPFNEDQNAPMWLNFENPSRTSMVDFLSPDRTAKVHQITVVESWVTVECVTDTCMDGRGLGCTDEERKNNLEKDTCPALITDGSNRVVWLNQAFKILITPEGGEGHAPAAEVVARMVVKEELPVIQPAFSCRVKLQYHTWKREKCSKMVPCDVWRMDFGGFAWRLDVRAALSLGL